MATVRVREPKKMCAVFFMGYFFHHSTVYDYCGLCMCVLCTSIQFITTMKIYFASVSPYFFLCIGYIGRYIYIRKTVQHSTNKLGIPEQERESEKKINVCSNITILCLEAGGYNRFNFHSLVGQFMHTKTEQHKHINSNDDEDDDIAVK